MAAISHDSAAVLKHFAERREIHYPLLSDPDSSAIRAFGILNEQIPKTHPFHGIPHPVNYVVSADGIVQARFFEEDYRERATATQMLVRHFGQDLKGGAGEAATRHLKAAWWASAATVRSGQRISLTLDVELKPGMHVYAPGVEGYIAIDWQMGASDGWRPHAAAYPPSEKLHLAAIQETVPVYRGRLRLVCDLTLGPIKAVKAAASASGDLVVAATLRYQACDDKQCFLPETVPIEWRFRLEDHDSQRVPEELRRKPPQQP